MNHIPAGWLMVERICSATVAVQSLHSNERSNVSATL